MTQNKHTPYVHETSVGANGITCFHAYPYGKENDILRGKNGVGRVFRSRESAEKAIKKARHENN